MMRYLALLCATILLGGCASTAASIITAPVRAVGQAADWATTSQDERDRALGRRVREREAELGRLERARTRAIDRCQRGDDAACTDAEAIREEMALLRDRPV